MARKGQKTMARERKPTSTSSFGVGRREGHDSSEFYERFVPPQISKDQEINRAPVVDAIYCADARHMPQLPDSSVALVVTSPPYFAGKDYEKEVSDGRIPSTYIDFLEMLTEVFAECCSKLEPGGRIAVNVANLGRKPFRSLSSDVTRILQDDLGLLLRGEILWQKAAGASGSTAWGSFQNSSNPVLRDLTERVIVASKGRFDRALSRRQRAAKDLPSEVTISKDEFMEATTDVWEIPPESANRVGHPAPFPVDLPLRLIRLYTYRGDLVLDPFMGSGTTAIAAVRSERHFAGYDLDSGYVESALARVQEERARLARPRQGRLDVTRVVIPAVEEDVDDGSFQARAVRQGQKAKEIARAVLLDCGFTDIVEGVRFKNGVEVNFIARDTKGDQWFFDVSGAFSSTRAGLRRTDTIWKALGRAALMRVSSPGVPRLILLTTDLPVRSSAGYAALKSARGEIYFDAIEMLSEAGQERLRRYVKGAREPVGDLIVPDEADD